MTVGTAALGSGILASTGSTRISYTYSAFKTALAADATSASDTAALSTLSAGSSFGMLINRTSDNPNGSGSATPYLDTAGANSTTINLTTANAKAIGLSAGTGTVGVCVGPCDASIQFNNTFDLDPSNGMTADQFV